VFRRRPLAALLVALNLGVWCLAVPGSAGAYAQPSSLADGHDYSNVCPPRPADSSSTDAQVVELVALEQEQADACVRSEQQDATSQGWTEFGSIVALTIGLVLTVAVVAGVVVILWR
jgi:hypothetical protein